MAQVALKPLKGRLGGGWGGWGTGRTLTFFISEDRRRENGPLSHERKDECASCLTDSGSDGWVVLHEAEVVLISHMVFMCAVQHH